MKQVSTRKSREYDSETSRRKEGIANVEDILETVGAFRVQVQLSE